MKKYVDVEELYNELIDKAYRIKSFGWGDIIRYRPSEIMEIIDSLKLIELPDKKEKEGEQYWIRNNVYFFGDEYYECPYCGFDIFLTKNKTPKDEKYNYCPHCGEKVETREFKIGQ